METGLLLLRKAFVKPQFYLFFIIINKEILHIYWLKAASTHIKSVIILGLYRCQRWSLYALPKKWHRKWNGLQILNFDFLPWEIFSIWISIACFCYFVDISAQNWHFFPSPFESHVTFVRLSTNNVLLSNTINNSIYTLWTQHQKSNWNGLTTFVCMKQHLHR